MAALNQLMTSREPSCRVTSLIKIGKGRDEPKCVCGVDLEVTGARLPEKKESDGNMILCITARRRSVFRLYKETEQGKEKVGRRCDLMQSTL